MIELTVFITDSLRLQMQHVLFTIKNTHLNLALATVHKMAVRFYFSDGWWGELSRVLWRFTILCIFRVVLMLKAIKYVLRIHMIAVNIFFFSCRRPLKGPFWLCDNLINLQLSYTFELYACKVSRWGRFGLAPYIPVYHEAVSVTGVWNNVEQKA